MDWTWALDGYVGGLLAIGAGVGVLAALLWWVTGGLWLLRRRSARVAVLLPLGLALGLGRMNEPLLAFCLSILWLATEVGVPRVVRAWWGKGTGMPATTAAFAAAGGLGCLGALWLGPLDPLGAFLASGVGQIALLGALLGASLCTVALGRCRITSPVLRAASGAAARTGWPAAPQRLAAAGVWCIALAALVAFSRFNLQLSERRSAKVISACRSYERDHGRLPRALEDLVPTYLPRIPRADWTTRAGFHYKAGEAHALSYYAPRPDSVSYLLDGLCGGGEGIPSPDVGTALAQPAPTPFPQAPPANPRPWNPGY